MKKYLLILATIPLITYCSNKTVEATPLHRTVAPVAFSDDEVPSFLVVEENGKLLVVIENSRLKIK